MLNPIYTYIKYIWFVFVGFHAISIIVGYLMLNPIYTYINNIWFVFVGFHAISIILGYLMLNPIYKYINIYTDFFLLGFMPYQSL